MSTMSEAKKVNVLGTDYTIRRVDSGQDEYMEKMHYGGYCDAGNLEIVILNLKSTKEWENDSDECIRRKENETLRHELFHAFLNESGLQWNSLTVDSAWAKNEEMVDWLAIQSPKIFKLFKELDIL